MHCSELESCPGWHCGEIHRSTVGNAAPNGALIVDSTCGYLIKFTGWIATRDTDWAMSIDTPATAVRPAAVFPPELKTKELRESSLRPIRKQD